LKRILVTGGSGFIGTHIAKDLQEAFEIVVLDTIKPGYDVEYRLADVTHEESFDALKGGFDALIHLAGIPHPLDEPARRVFSVNTLGTFNVMSFAARTGIGKVVLASSESTLGFAFARTENHPLYFPIDEHHPLAPQDPYGLSKVCSEEILKGYSRAHGISTISLRFPWVWAPKSDRVGLYKSLVHEYQKWQKNLWAWVNVHDVSQAFTKAIEYDKSGFERFFITANDNWTGVPSVKLIERFYPGTQIVRPLPENRSLISSDLAKVVLKYSPQYGVEQTLS